MTEIKNSTLQQLKMQVATQTMPRIQAPNMGSTEYAKDEFVRFQKKNGIVERLYNGYKNLTGLGIGSKKVQAELAKVDSGYITDEQARETIAKYRNSQVNSAQAFGDLMSVGAADITFFATRKAIKTQGAKAVLNEKYYQNAADMFYKKLNKPFLKFGKSNKKV